MFNVLEYLKTRGEVKLLNEIGLGSLIHLKCRQLRRDFCFYLLESFDVETSEFNYHGHAITLNVEDVVQILGLKNEGVDVSIVLKGENPRELMKKFGFTKDVKYSEIEQRMKKLDADSEELKACILMYIVGTFLCPTSTTYPNEKLWNLLCEEGLNGKLNWAKYVHEFLIKGMEKYLERQSDREQAYFHGCALVLEVNVPKFETFMS